MNYRWSKFFKNCYRISTPYKFVNDKVFDYNKQLIRGTSFFLSFSNIKCPIDMEDEVDYIDKQINPKEDYE